MSTKGASRLQKLQLYQRNIEALILHTDTDDDLRLLGAALLTAAKRSLVTTEGFARAKELMVQFAHDMVPPEQPKKPLINIDKPEKI